MPKELGTATLDTTNDYVTLLEVTLPPNITKVSIQLKENNTNAIKYKIEGTLDGTNFGGIKNEATLAKNATIIVGPSVSGTEDLADPWYKIRVQHKADVADTQGNTTCTMYGS